MPSFGAATATSSSSGGPGEVSDNGKQARLPLQKRTFPLSRKELLAVSLLFLAFAVLLAIIYFTMPSVDYNVLKFPRNIDDLRVLKDYLATYAEDYTSQVVLGYFTTYVFMQTFMIPGTIFMSLLAGALFGVIPGLILVVTTATAGASACYFLSMQIGRPIAFWLWPEKLTLFCDEVAKRKRSLLNYMLFLRITPALPNTFINVSSPIVGIPYPTFFLATFFGLIPAAFVTVRAGLTLGELQSFSDLYDMKTLVTLFFIGIVSVLPTVLAEKVKRKK